MSELKLSPIPVLLVEDHPSFARALTQVLAHSDLADCEVVHVDSLGRATSLLGQCSFDVILLDLSLPDSSGIQTVEAVHQASPGTPIVVLTALDDETLGREAVRRGAQDFLIKTQADDRLVVRAIRYAIERQRIVKERDHLIEQLQVALTKVKQLSGLLPICCVCKKVRDDRGYWNQIELYIRDHSEAEFSHGLCPQCAAQQYAELYERPAEP
jgi:DNA-binding NtrC family response regulator